MYSEWTFIPMFPHSQNEIIFRLDIEFSFDKKVTIYYDQVSKYYENDILYVMED